MNNIVPFRKADTAPKNVRRSATKPNVWPINSVMTGTGEAWLQEAIAGTEIEPMALAIWMQYPTLQVASERLASYITPFWPSADGGSLLRKTIAIAVNNVDMAIRGGDTFKGRQVGVYLYGLASCTAEIARIAVYGEDKEGAVRNWHYFSEPLPEWAARHGMQELQVYLASPEPTEREILGLRTIMVGRVAGNHIDVGNLEMYAARG